MVFSVDSGVPCASPAGRTSPHHHHRGLDDGVGVGVGWLVGYGDRRCWITGHGSWETCGAEFTLNQLRHAFRIQPLVKCA